VERFWQSRLKPSREGICWAQVLGVVSLSRLIAPGSEWRLHRHWFDQSTLADLMGGDFSLAAKETAYSIRVRSAPSYPVCGSRAVAPWRCDGGGAISS